MRQTTPIKTRSLFMALLRELLRRVLGGLRSLSTPKGILALVPLIVSAAAYVKASYVETTIRLVVASPLEVRMDATQDGVDRWAASYQIPQFEAFLASSGKETILLSDLKINVVAGNDSGAFDEICNYLTPGGDGSTEVVEPMRLTFDVLTPDYKIRLSNALVVLPNSILPLGMTPTEDTKPIETARLGRALAATRTNLTISHAMAIVEARPERIELCMSGRGYSAGSPRIDFAWMSPRDGQLWTDIADQKSMALPAAPGGTAQPATWAIVYTLRGQAMAEGLLLTRFARFHWF